MYAPPPPYVELQPNGSIRPPPYHHRKVPQYRPKKSGIGCMKCICCCYCFLFFLILLLAGLTFYFYTLYKPMVPSYKVKSMDIKAFEAQPDFSLKTEFIVNVEANNPNTHISLIYGQDSSVVVWYKDSNLCSGKLPAFHQGTNNITVMQIDLKGKSEFGSGLQEALTENKKSGRVPLLVAVKAPVTIELGSFRLRQFVVYVNCSLVLDSLSPNKKPGIISSKYDIDASL